MRKYLFLLLPLYFMACQPLTQPNPNLFTTPKNFPPVIFQAEVTPEKFILGKKLFYDPILSVDSSISCASCHQQAGAFSDIDQKLSQGVFHRLGKRNSPTLQNLAWQSQFFWDGGTLHLDAQPLAPMLNPLEMGEKLLHIQHKLRRNKNYFPLFRDAFGMTDTAQITVGEVGKSLAIFMKMLVSNQSKYDKFLANEVSFTDEEQAGLSLFQEKCATCHSGILFTDLSFRNNGLALSSDSGRAHITQNLEDLYKFKVPSLRNIEKSAPYMHDGRLLTLESVLNHYANEVQSTTNLAPELQQNGILGIPLTPLEQQQIIVFLKTLTDEKFLKDKRFAEKM